MKENFCLESLKSWLIVIGSWKKFRTIRDDKICFDFSLGNYVFKKFFFREFSLEIQNTGYKVLVKNFHKLACCF